MSPNMCNLCPRSIHPRGERVGVRVIPSPGAGPLTLRSLEEPVPAKAGGRAGSLAPPIRHLSLRPATSLTVIPMPREESRTCPLMPFTYLPLPLPSTEQSATWVRSTHVALCSSFLLSLRALKGERDKGGEGSPVGSRGIPLRSCTFALPEPPCYTTHQATDLVPRGPSQERNKGVL